MILITSPAKLMRVPYTDYNFDMTTPQFLEKSAQINAVLKKMSPAELQKLMEINSKIADENWQRNQDWTSTPSEEQSAPAIFAFTGEVYRGLDAPTLSKSELEYLQSHYRMLSGLYGLLRPYDRMMLYRMEMGRPIAIGKAKNLYEFWQDLLTEEMNHLAKGHDFLLNLASKEYQKVLNRKKLSLPVVDVDFLQYKDGVLKNIVVYTKHARGLMVRYCAKNKVETLEEVKLFSLENYAFYPEKSTDKKLTFVR